jgi:UDP-2,3-diacylglucosamine hydrolase
MDVNADAVTRLFTDSGATRMIHGHTHRPARHDYLVRGRQVCRWVLPAWDDRPGYLRIDADGAEHLDFD